MSQTRVEAFMCSCAISLPVHKLVLTTCHLMLITAFHLLDFGLNSIPVGFYVLCMYTCRTDKFNGVVNCFMLSTFGIVET